ncbi:MAG: aldolase/citrate lyase family protein [Saprospiraceae bacterium]
MNLLLFYSNLAKTIETAGSVVNEIIIDWENKGKEIRQVNYDTEVNKHTLADLIELRKYYDRKIICRVNGGQFFNEREVKSAIDAGADELFLPMVTHPREVEKMMRFTKEQCALSILVETKSAVTQIEQLTQFALAKIYFGLNDYAIDCGVKNIFLPLTDGTVKKVANHCKARNIPFGFGGLTHPDLGYPISAKLLLAEMVRCHASFSFLRRTFYRDLNAYSPNEIYNSIQTNHSILHDTSAKILETYHQQLTVQIQSTSYEKHVSCSH